jgi:hypothetical protein
MAVYLVVSAVATGAAERRVAVKLALAHTDTEVNGPRASIDGNLVAAL